MMSLDIAIFDLTRQNLSEENNQQKQSQERAIRPQNIEHMLDHDSNLTSDDQIAINRGRKKRLQKDDY